MYEVYILRFDTTLFTQCEANDMQSYHIKKTNTCIVLIQTFKGVNADNNVNIAKMIYELDILENGAFLTL